MTPDQETENFSIEFQGRNQQKFFHQESYAEVFKNDVRPVSHVLRERRLSFVGHCMRSNQPIADILVWDCDNHLEKEGGKGCLVRRGQGNTKTYLK